MTTTQVLRGLFDSVNARLDELTAEAQEASKGAYTDAQIREAHGAVGQVKGLTEALGMIGAALKVSLDEDIVALATPPKRKRFGRS